MNPELQRAQDMLAAMQMQRDNALNAMVMAQAEIAARDREIATLREQVNLAKVDLAALVGRQPLNGTKGSGHEYSDSDVHPGVAV